VSSSLWWKDAVIYHVYPRSFRDSNRDGFGDLPGLVEKLDHLAWLGVDALWMGPIFRSPQVDNGYDISDYRDVDPLFGSLADLDHLISEAHRMGIRVLLDLVFNHSSTEHPWFQASRDDPDGEYGDYYHWADPAPDGGLPNNWRGFFSLPTWTWSEERGQYYMNLFAPEQADLNWANPRVRQEMADIANFWLDRGVDGFRMDVINLISKAHGYPSIPSGGHYRGYYIDGPDALGWIQQFRTRLRNPNDVLLVGEVFGTTPITLRRWTAEEHRALNMVISFEHVMVDYGPGGKWDPGVFRPSHLASVLSMQQEAFAGSSWPCPYAGNHDHPRAVSRFGDDAAFRYESAVAIATLFLLLRGTPIIYQGDEIGMRNYPFSTADEFRDVKSLNAFRALIADAVDPAEAFRRITAQARDHSRTPMQWSDAQSAGFTDEGVTPWFPVNPDYQEWNVHAERALAENGESSVIGAYRRLLTLRRDHEVLRMGTCELLDFADESPVIGFRRRLVNPGGSAVVLVLINFSSMVTDLPVLPEVADNGGRTELLFGTHSVHDPWSLKPWEVRVLG
jgi:oligo-1,6-glucosidase